MEKYEELYRLSKEILTAEQHRFTRIDEKASKYLSVLTLLIGLYGVFARWLMDNLFPAHAVLDWVLATLGLGLFLSLVFSWFKIFSVFRIHQLKVMPLNDETMEFFDNNRLLDIYYALAKGNKAALEENRRTSDAKSKLLSAGYKGILGSGVFFILFSFAYGVHTLSTKSGRNVTKRSYGMADQGQTENTSQPAKPDVPAEAEADKPNPNVQPPTYDVVTEGNDPSKVKGAKTAVKTYKDKR